MDSKESQWQKINEIVVDWKDKTVLDYGSGDGYFSFQAAKHGAYVLGIERDVEKARVIINQLIHKTPEIAKRVVVKKYWDEDCSGTDWHIVFAFDILRRIGKDKAEKFLAELGNVGAMFLAMPVDEESDWLASVQATVDWVKDHSKFNSISVVSSEGKERTLFICQTQKEVPVKSTSTKNS